MNSKLSVQNDQILNIEAEIIERIEEIKRWEIRALD